ncbi:MAG TPA: tetratricopeptide repeat protein, partial [Blastocatellia bacterium]|nr:tetratricopeptide repeat protein [Blastocatellia bacterium]
AQTPSRPKCGRRDSGTLVSHDRAEHAGASLAASIESLANRRSILLICLLALLAYANSLAGEFVFDDTDKIVTNQNLRSWTNLAKAFTTDVWAFREEQPGIDAPPRLPYYRPIFTVMLTIEFQLFGLWPQGWHLVSLLLLILASVAVFYVILLLSRRKLVAMFAASLFAVHPVHAESVSWISGMTDPLFSIFFLASLFFFLVSRKAGAPAEARDSAAKTIASRRALTLSVVSFVIAAFSKETALSLVPLVFVYELGESPGKLIARARQAAGRALPYAAASMLYLIPRYLVLGELMWKNPQAPDRPLVYTLMTLPFVVVSYVFHLVWPVSLSVSYDTRFITSATSPMFLFPVAAILACAIGLLACRNRINREVWLALVLIFVPLLPVLNLDQVSREEYLVFDHYLYLSVAGFAYLVGIGLARLGGFESRAPGSVRRATLSLVAMGGLLLTTVTVAANENRSWSDSYSLWSNAARVRPSNWAAHYNVGLALLDQSRFSQAREALGRAAALKPDEAVVFDALGRASGGAGDLVEAEKSFKRALEVDPELFESLNNLGELDFRRKDYTSAEGRFVAAIRIRPDATAPRFNLGLCLARLGRYQEAAREFERVTQLAPDAEAYYELGLVYEKLGRPRDAERALTRGREVATTQDLVESIDEGVARVRGQAPTP